STTPANDDCTTAQTISDGAYAYDCSAATSAQVAPSSAPYRDVWFYYVSPCSGSVVLSLNTSTAAFQASFSLVTLNTVGCTNATACSLSELAPVATLAGGASAAVSTTLGVPYFVRAGTSSVRSVGANSFTIQCFSAPPNDRQSNATLVSGAT